MVDPTLAASIPTPTWSDALDRLGIAGVARGLTWRSGSGRLAGRAVTVLEEVGGLGAYPADAFDVGAILRAAGAGDVLVIDAGGAEVSTVGGLAAAAARSRGIDGIVADGACRDLDEIRATGLRLVTRHVTPASGRGRIRVAGIGVRITCGGVPVETGDIVIADETGTIVVPVARYDEALTLARELDDRDRRFRAALDEGQEFGALAKALGHL
jgi:regulator of RNase E activity RraA